MRKKDKIILERMLWAEEQEELAKERAKTALKCIFCGDPISQYGPETFHIDSGLIRCDEGNTRATAEVISKESL